MASTVWKGYLTFGLVSIPVKLSRAARPEKVSFRQLHASTGARVRQALVSTAPEPEPEEEPEPEPVVEPARVSAPAPRGKVAPFIVPPAAAPPPPPVSAPDPGPREVRREEIVKGYEFAKDQFVTISKEELAAITPKTAREMQILEFVRLAEVDPVYFETSYYVTPDKGGERAYSLLFAALRQSELVGVAQLAMHNREHVVILRPGRRGVILHTMFYESEIRGADEFHADTSGVNQKELDLALLLVKNLEAPFEPAKYRDTYKEQVEALIEAKMAGQETVQAPAPKSAPVVNILEALQRSLEATAGASGRKPPASEEAPATVAAAPAKRGRKKA